MSSLPSDLAEDNSDVDSSTYSVDNKVQQEALWQEHLEHSTEGNEAAVCSSKLFCSVLICLIGLSAFVFFMILIALHDLNLVKEREDKYNHFRQLDSTTL